MCLAGLGDRDSTSYNRRDIVCLLPSTRGFCSLLFFCSFSTRIALVEQSCRYAKLNTCLHLSPYLECAELMSRSLGSNGVASLGGKH